MSDVNSKESMRSAYGKAIQSGKIALNAEHCFAPHGECEGKIIQAHTISKCHGLRRIAKNGEVYQVKSNQFEKDFDQLMTMRRTGVSAVSTFRGFCAKHDAEIFDPVENHPFSMSREQVFLLMFRTVAKELFLKQVQEAETENLKKLCAAKLGVSIDELIATSTGESYEDGVSAGVNELLDDKKRMDNMLIQRDFSEIECCIIRCGKVPNLVCSGYYSPFFDFKGNPLQQDAQGDQKLNSLYCNVIAKERGGWIILAYFRDEADGPEQQIQSLLSTGQPDAAAAWLSLVHFENAAYKIDWWDALPEAIQSESIKTFRDVSNPISPVENQLQKMAMEGFVNWEPGPAKWISD